VSVLDVSASRGRVASAIITGAAIGIDRVIANTLVVWFRASQLDESRGTFHCLQRLQLPEPERTKPQCR
jgi:hypothetical protein